VVDYNLFTPGKPLKPNTLWILEQLPTLTQAADMTHTLALGYWPSYNKGTALILHSYCTHTALILHSYCTHTALILHSYCTHTALILALLQQSVLPSNQRAVGTR
jgi:hypothetical protein